MTSSPPVAPTSRTTRLMQGIALAVATCVVVSLVFEALRVPYLADDWWLIGVFEQNGYRDAIRAILAADDPAATGRFYRPVWRLSFALDALLGARPWVSHAANLGLHGACSYALLRLASNLGLGAVAAGLAALLFLIHPAGFQPTNWVASRSDLLGMVFALGGLNAVLQGRSGRALVLLGLGLLSKESAFVALPLALGLLGAARGPAERSSRIRLGLGIVALGAAVLALRWSRLNDPFGGYSVELALFSMPFGLVLDKWAATAALTWMPLEVGPALRAGFGGVSGICACAAARAERESRAALAVGLSLFLLSLLALHGLGTDSYLDANGRFTYGPAAGLALLAGGVLQAAGRELAALAGLGLLVLYGSMSWSVHRAGAAAVARVVPRLELAREVVAAATGPLGLVGLQRTAGPHWVAPYLVSYGLRRPFQELESSYGIALILATDHAEGRMPRAVFSGLGAAGASIVALDDAFRGPGTAPNTGPVLRFDAPGDLLQLDLGAQPGIVRLLAEPAADPVVPLGFGAAGSLELARPALVFERMCEAGMTEVRDFTQQFGAPGRFRLQAVRYKEGRVSFGPMLELDLSER